MKRRISIFLLIPILFFLLVICYQFSAEEATSISRIMISWDDTRSDGWTRLFERDGVYYAFLPSYADLGRLNVHTDAGYSVWINDIAWKDAALNDNTTYTLSIKNACNQTIAESQFMLMKSANIPALSIQLYNSTISDIEQFREESGHMSFIDADCNITYEGDFESFHIRGNHTATLPKKPYALRFSEDIDLLGTGGYTTYCLIANADDESKLRNKLAYETAAALGLEHSPESIFVDLYIDNTYYGLYMLTEKIAIGENRINLAQLQEQTQDLNFFSLKQYDAWSSDGSGTLRRGLSIPVNPSDITGGYLLELEVDYRMEENTNTFFSNSGQLVNIKYPAQCSAEQVNYIADFYQQVENSAAEGTFSKYIDVESWAKFYLIQEYFAQVDRASIYFYKDSDTNNSKLYAGPVWDFDWSIGLSESNSDTLSFPPDQYYFRWGVYEKLFEHDSFSRVVKTIFENEFSTIISEFLPAIYNYYQEQISASYAMDKCRWEGIFVPPHGPYAGSLHGSIAVLKDWTAQRNSFFYKNFMDDAHLIQLTLYSEENNTPYASYFLPANSHFTPDAATPVKPGFQFIGWYDQSGNQLTESTLLCEDSSYFAKWEAQPNGTPSIAKRNQIEHDSESDASFEKLLDYSVLLLLAVIAVGVPTHIVFDIIKAQKGKKDQNNE